MIYVQAPLSKTVFDSAWRDHLPTLKSVIETHDLRARKSLGQNFIMDPAITDRIARTLGDVSGKRLIEIGPGPGGLTRSLLSTNADQVVAIEFDHRAVAALEHLQAAAGPRLHIIHGDALKLDWSALFKQHPHNLLVANLPYNISTVLLAQWLRLIADQPRLIEGMTLMFQKEVAERLTARVKSADYGRLSVLTQWLCTVDVAMTLPPGAFVPPPKIYSSVVRFTPRGKTHPQVKWETLDNLLQAAFMHRRKMLRSNLKDVLPLLKIHNIAETDRAQDITLDQYLALAADIKS